jgi:hypothetical protein
MKSGTALPIVFLLLLARPAPAQVLVAPSGDQIVLTDPLVRTTQLGYVPVGTLAGLDTRTGIAWVWVPGSGGRWVRLTGTPVATASGFVASGVDLATGVELRVIAPAVRDPLVPATVLRVSANGVTVRRRGASASQAELLPLGSVYFTRNGWTLPANGALGTLAPGAQVLIPATGGARGAIDVQRPAPSAAGAATRRSPPRRAATKPRR